MCAYISIDLSLRSTGIVALDENCNLLDFRAIQNAKVGSKQAKKRKQLLEVDDEDLIILNANKISKFIDNVIENNVLNSICIEGLSFGGISGKKDLIHGNFWFTRANIHVKYKYILFGVIPVTAWRKSVLTKELRKRAKEKYGSGWIKQVVVDQLPANIYKEFMSYIEFNKLDKKTIFDLADAYFLGVYRISLTN